MKQLKTLLVVLLAALAGMGGWVWKTKSEVTQLQGELKQSIQETETKVAQKEQEMKEAITALENQHQKDVSALLEKHQKELDTLRDGERKRMADAFRQFSDILDGNKQTLDYINALEQKVKSGQAISANEAEKLATIATGLSYLQKQYQKPFQEFSELEAYFAKRADENINTPNMRNAFWKRIFSRNFREKEREFYRTEGERRGFQEASTRFNAAYAKAQRQMKDADLNFDKSLQSIQQLIDQKKTPENLDEFFSKARKALTTHQELLDFVPDPAPQVEAVKP